MSDMNQKNNKPVILAIFGKSAAGKDTLKDILRNWPAFHIMRQWTTRPMRELEVQDCEYHFCSIAEFT
jgi:guanylate kinase